MSPRRLALVTGASSGIGAATAVRLGRDGWKVILLARRAEKLTEIARAVDHAGGEALIEAVDAADGEAVITMASRVIAAHGAPDFIVHCAGAGQWKYVEDTSPAELASMMSAPFAAAFHVNHAFLRPMIQRGSGVLVHVNSPAALSPWPGSAGYACARWALRGLHEALVQDLAGTGVRSCHAVFGEVSSEYFSANPNSHDRLPKIAALIPISTPDDCAAAIVPLADRPRDLVKPLVLRGFYWLHAVAPWLVRWTSRLTGHRRP
jgi:NADP-dependent 3-hydroxy acid dehydrogenase YdfG